MPHRSRCRIRCETGSIRLRGFIDQHDGRGPCSAGGEFVIDDQNARPGIPDDVGDFVGGQAEIDRQENRADMACGERDIEKRRTVFHQHGDDVIRADAARNEPSAHASDPRVEGGVGNFLAAVFQRTALRRPSGVVGDEAR